MGEHASPAARHLVLVTVDTWRGDHVLAARAGEPLTPFLDRLAEEAIVFHEAMSVSDATTPGTAGVLTGLWPHRSGVIANNHVIGEEVGTLAETLRAAGFRTGGFVSNPNLRSGSGFERGFERYERLRPAPDPTRPGRVKVPAARVREAAAAWLAELDPERERIFLWVHYMEPHGPYRPPQWARALFPPEAFDAPASVPLAPDNSGRGGIPEYQHPGEEAGGTGDARDYLARYAGEVRAIDDELERLFGLLARERILHRSVRVVTADHGEALAGERGAWFSHANGAGRDQVHVPLLLAFPGCEGGRVVDEPVSTVDVVPSALALLGVEPPRGLALDGRWLLEEGPRAVLSVTQSEVSLRSDRLRLIARPDGTPRLLVDDREDPAGERDLAGERPDELRALQEELERLRRLEPLARPTPR